MQLSDNGYIAILVTKNFDIKLKPRIIANYNQLFKGCHAPKFNNST